MRKYLNDNNSGKWKLLFYFQLEDCGGVEFLRATSTEMTFQNASLCPNLSLLLLCKCGKFENVL